MKLDSEDLKYIENGQLILDDTFGDIKDENLKEEKVNLEKYIVDEVINEIRKMYNGHNLFNEGIASPDYKPNNTGIAYKVFYVKNGKLYPPMVANPGGADTPVGVWLIADVGENAGTTKTGRQQVKAGGKGTQGGGGKLAFRPGWHLGEVPLAPQFYRTNPQTGEKEFPKDFVWAECEYSKDKNYQEDAMSYGYTKNGKFQHSLAGLPRVPEDGYYQYRTNPNPNTVPWIITGAMKINKLLSDKDVKEILAKNNLEAPNRQGGSKTLQDMGLKEEICSKNLKIFCEFSSKPETWSEYWNPSNCEVVWGYKKNLKEEKVDKNQLKERAKRHKKTLTKKAKGWWVNLNAGNVEHNINFFNHVMGSDTSDNAGPINAGAGEGGEAGGMGESLNIDDTINEKIEKHDTLNPVLWDENEELLPEVKERLEMIINKFITMLKKDEININVLDKIIIGSNASYNYTKDSDLDLHIVADTKQLNIDPKVSMLLYNAYRNIFNTKYDIKIKNIDVELFIEENECKAQSNGKYSLITGWIKKPEQKEIPDVNIETEFKEWEDKFKKLKEEPTLIEVNDLIDAIYDLRQSGMIEAGEYSKGNLVFKEFRNNGYLEELKKLKLELESKELSLN